MKQKYYFGEAIGMITWKLWYQSIVKGHHTHMLTYDFPIRLKFIEKYYEVNSRKFNLSEYIKCAKELENEGVKAITTNCGLTGDMQIELANAVNVPVFCSNLLIVPVVLRMLGENKKVAILTDSSKFLEDNEEILINCGIDPRSPRILIQGMFESEFRDIWVTQFHNGDSEKEIRREQEGFNLPITKIGEFKYEQVETAIVSVSKNIIRENPEIGAIVLECTEMPLYAKAIRRATGRLVFDSVSLVKYIYFTSIC